MLSGYVRTERARVPRRAWALRPGGGRAPRRGRGSCAVPGPCAALSPCAAPSPCTATCRARVPRRVRASDVRVPRRARASPSGKTLCAAAGLVCRAGSGRCAREGFVRRAGAVCRAEPARRAAPGPVRCLQERLRAPCRARVPRRVRASGVRVPCRVRVSPPGKTLCVVPGLCVAPGLCAAPGRIPCAVSQKGPCAVPSPCAASGKDPVRRAGYVRRARTRRGRQGNTPCAAPGWPRRRQGCSGFTQRLHCGWRS